MIDPLVTFVLLAAIAAVSIGAARIVSWLLDRRDRAAVQRANEAAIVVQARAELAATGWTDQDECAYRERRWDYACDAEGFLHVDQLDPCDEDEFYGIGDYADAPFGAASEANSNGR
ncbi:hypothetical protein I5U23_16525 [Stenotrophomonas maltophilia]|nr:hypothetical protein [Stenotrophomonas maltophilia]HEL4242953.1 hypothetical protein [Stenotrophomonas maltophilia]